MHRLNLSKRDNAPLTILCIGAHSDDIEIGCGATVLRLLHEHPDAQCHWIVLSASGSEERAEEAKSSARAFLGANAASIEVKGFRDAYFPFHGEELKNYFEEFKRRLKPDIVLTHYKGDLHQDHKIVADLTWNTYRNHMILEYEIPKYDGGLGSPNFFVPVEESLVEAKIERLMTHFGSQRSRQWFTPETFRGLMRIRGLECNSPSGFAEAYYCRKCTI